MNVHGDLQSAGVAGFAICLVSMAASVFTVSALLPDEMIEPKWYAACGAALVGGIVLGIIGIVLCGVNYPIYKRLASQKTKALLPVIDEAEEKLANLLERGNELLSAERI